LPWSDRPDLVATVQEASSSRRAPSALRSSAGGLMTV